MITIWKYPLEMDNKEFVVGYHARWKEYYDIIVPYKSKLLCVQTQHGVPCLWFQVDTSSSVTTTRRFIIVGTGNEIKHYDMVTYVGTFQLFDGSFVGHVFEGKL